MLTRTLTEKRPGAQRSAGLSGRGSVADAAIVRSIIDDRLCHDSRRSPTIMPLVTMIDDRTPTVSSFRVAEKSKLSPRRGLLHDAPLPDGRIMTVP